MVRRERAKCDIIASMSHFGAPVSYETANDPLFRMVPSQPSDPGRNCNSAPQYFGRTAPSPPGDNSSGARKTDAVNKALNAAPRR